MSLPDALEYVETLQGNKPQDPIAIALPHPHLQTDAEFQTELDDDRREYQRQKRRNRRLAAQQRKAA
jgi:hypothetical protein